MSLPKKWTSLSKRWTPLSRRWSSLPMREVLRGAALAAAAVFAVRSLPDLVRYIKIETM